MGSILLGDNGEELSGGGNTVDSYPAQNGSFRSVTPQATQPNKSEAVLDAQPYFGFLGK